MKRYFKILRDFGQDQQGNVLMIVGLAGLSLLGAMGLSVDYGRVQYAGDRLQQSLDAAALAGAHQIGRTDADVVRVAQRYMDANFPQGLLNAGRPIVNVQRVTSTTGVNIWGQPQTTSGLRFTTNALPVQNFFMPAANVFAGGGGAGTQGASNIGAMSEVGTKPISPVDIVFALDVSGSMAWKDGEGLSCALAGSMDDMLCRCGVTVGSACNQNTPGLSNSSRLAGAKAAMKGFFSIFNNGLNRFGITPWDNKVNILGKTNYGWAGFVSGDTVNTGNATTYYGTNIRPVTYLTNNYGAVNSAVDNMLVDGDTDSANGILWGMRQFQNPFGDNVRWNEWAGLNPNMVLILMTDGFNTSFYGDPGRYSSHSNPDSLRTQSNARTVQHCQEAQAMGIAVYTIAYNVVESNAGYLDYLRNCAGPDRFFAAQDYGALMNALQSIANQLVTVRLTR